MSRDHLRVNRFGFAEYEDTVEFARNADLAGVAEALDAVAELVLSENSVFLDSMSPSARADFAVPVGMAGEMLPTDGYSPVELVAAASAVRYCAGPHLSEFPDDLVRLLSKLPR